MISAQQAAKLFSAYSSGLQLQFVYDKIATAARQGLQSVVYDKYLSTAAVEELQQQGYKLYHDECERGMSFWVISWKHACM